MNPTTATSTATTATSIVTSTTTVSSTFAATGPTIGSRTLDYGFEEPAASNAYLGGRLDTVFIRVLGAAYIDHQAMIDKICIDIARVGFVSPSEPAFFEQVASNMKSRLQELDRIDDLKALIKAIENASKANKSDKRNKNKNAEKGNRKEDSNSSDGNIVRRAVKRMSMRFTKADRNTSKGAQKEITRQQFLGLIKQEEGKTHGKDWAESSDWWTEHGGPAQEPKPASEHESFGS